MNLNPRAQELYESSRKATPRLVNSAASAVYLYGVVGQDFTAASVVEALAELERTKGPVTLFVNSPGGDYFAGKAIHAALARFARSHKMMAVVDGVAASAASLLVMAAPRIEMSPGSTMMVHEVHGTAVGRAQDLEAQAALIRAENEQLAGLYAKRTGMDHEKVMGLLAAETWFTAEQAVEQKFADGIAGEPPKAAKTSPKNQAALMKRANDIRINALRASASSTSASREQ